MVMKGQYQNCNKKTDCSLYFFPKINRFGIIWNFILKKIPKMLLFFYTTRKCCLQLGERQETFRFFLFLINLFIVYLVLSNVYVKVHQIVISIIYYAMASYYINFFCYNSGPIDVWPRYISPVFLICCSSFLVTVWTILNSTDLVFWGWRYGLLSS